MSDDRPKHSDDTEPIDLPATATQAHAALPGAVGVPRRVGQYSIKRAIASGGMGTVYEALQEQPRRTVAVKLMRAGITSRSALSRFEYESHLLAQLRHPGIAQVYEAGTHRDGEVDVPYFAMEYIVGAKSLTDYAGEKKLGTRERMKLFCDVCEAVHHGHQKGIIHRDLKPSNILVDSSGRVKIIDFGVARSTDSDIAVTTMRTDVGQLIGTLQYMSPEQCAANPYDIDTRSDVYALGVVFYELLAGRLPYELTGTGIHEATRIIREQEATRLSTQDKTLRGDVETIVLKALEKDRDRRYQSASALVADIERYLNNETISARPASAMYQFKKLVSRHKVPFAFVVVLFLTVSAFGVWMSVMYSRAEQLRVAAVAAEQEQALARKEAEEARDSLETITEFQQSMLSDIDVEEMGRGIVTAERESIRKAMESAGVAPERVETALASFDELLAKMNATNLALDVVEEHVIARAVETIDEEFADQPVTRAAMQQTVSTTYRQLGIYEPAIRLQQSALAIRREELGDDHPSTLSSIRNMGSLLRRLGRLDEALPYNREALEGHRRVLGDDHQDTLVSINNLAMLLDMMGKHAEAEPYYREAVDGSRRILGVDHPETLNSINNMGVLLQAQGKLEEAMPYYRDALAGNRRVVGDDHPKTLTSINNMGALLMEMGRPDEAMPYYREALEGNRRVLGDDHPHTLRSINNMGHLLNGMGRHDGAVEVLLGGEPAARRAFTGSNAKWLGAYLTKLGEAQNGLRQHPDAEATLLEAHGLLVAGFGEDHARTAKAINQLIVLYDAWHVAEPGKGHDAKAAEWRAKLPKAES